jgi:hypothetical protein
MSVLDSSTIPADAQRETLYAPRPHRGALALLFTACFLLGLVPAAFVIGKPWLVLAVAAVEAVIACTLATQRHTVSKTIPPSRIEVFLAAVGALFPPLLLGLLMLATYAFVTLVVHGLEHLTDTTGESIRAYLAVVWLVVFAGVYAYIGTSQAMKQLYPGIAGTRSPLYALTIQRRRLKVWGATSVVVLVVVAVLTALGFRTWPLVGLEMFLLGLTATIRAFSERTAGTASARTRNTMARLLESRGFEVVQSPRTGDVQLDPLISRIDLLAYSQDRAFAVDVLDPEQHADPASWREASDVQLATSALLSASDLMKIDVPVEPVLVLPGLEEDKTLKLFCERERVHVVQLDSDIVDKARGAGENELRALAADQLGFLGPVTQSRVAT